MRKALFIILTAVVFLSCAYADTGTILFRFKINKFVAENATLFFTDTSRNPINTYTIDFSRGLNSPQVYLAVETNRVNPYALKATFSTMKYSDKQTDPSATPDASFFGYYHARVFDVDTYPIVFNNSNYLDVNLTSGAFIIFDGDNSPNVSTVTTFYYPISFYFPPEYMDDYGIGAFEGSIKVEVAIT